MTKKLLLADDSITIQKVIGIIFATEDYQLLVTDNGDEAYDKALEELPDLVIADVSMPGKDGFELCQLIKSESRLAKTAVMLLPGTFDHFDEQRAQEVGADGWLTKPFESQALLDKVAQLLEAQPARVAEAATTDLDAAATFAADETAADFGVSLEETEDSSLATDVDESVLGLDQVDEPPVAEEAFEESPEDIWDAVSFEEEDLQEPLEAEESPGTAAVSFEDVAVEGAAEGTVAEVDEEEPFASADDAQALSESPLEPVEEPVLEVAEEPTDVISSALKLDSEDAGQEDGFVLAEDAGDALPADAAEDAASERLAVAGAFADDTEAQGAAEDVLELMADDNDAVETAAAPESASADALPVVEPLAEESLAAGEEVLELADEDIIEEEPVLEVGDLIADEPAEELAAEVGEEEPLEELLEESLEELPEEALEEPLEELPEEPAFTTGFTAAAPAEEGVALSDEAEVSIDAPAEPAEDGFYFDASEGETSADEPIDADVAAVAGEELDAVAQAEQQLRQLSDEELKEVVAKVAGPIVEKLAGEMLEQIAWEVVPDLAESMIREEIRKIKHADA